jgi:DnaK suppressor protein
MHAHNLATIPAITRGPRGRPPGAGLTVVERSFDRFKSMIEEAKRELLASSKRTQAGSSSIDRDDLADDMDLANAEYSQSLTLQFLDRDKYALDELQSALDRIEDGTFGICEGCGGEISEKRLAARPTTTLCIQCKEDEEREAKRSFG